MYVPNVSETVKSKTVVEQPPKPNSNQPLTSYEETTLKTVSTPGHYVEAFAMVTLTQQDTDVLITIDGRDAAGGSLNDITEYIKEFGHKVNN